MQEPAQCKSQLNARASAAQQDYLIEQHMQHTSVSKT
jgi:hypothetical protein